MTQQKNFKGLTIVTSDLQDNKTVAINWSLGQYVLIDSPDIQDAKTTSKFLISSGVWDPHNKIITAQEDNCENELTHLTQINPRDFY